MIKHQFLGDFWGTSAQSWQDRAAPTFEINGHGASVTCYCNYIRIKGWNLINLAQQKRHRLHINDKTSILGDFWGTSAQNWQDRAAPTFEINGHGASV